MGKVILSACSPFFRNVLRKNPHQHPREEESEVQEIEEVQTVKAEPREQQSYLQENQSYASNQESAVALEDSYQEEYGDYAQYEGQYDAIDPNTGLPIADGNKGETSLSLTHFTFSLDTGNVTVKIWQMFVPSDNKR